MYRDRPQANPAPTHTTHALHDGNGFSYSLQLGSHRSGHGETIPTPGMRHADADAERCRRPSPCVYVCVFLCATRLARRPACPPVAQQLSICQSVNLRTVSSRFLQASGTTKITERIGTPGLSTAEDGTLQVTGLAGSPSLPA